MVITKVKTFFKDHDALLASIIWGMVLLIVVFVENQPKEPEVIIKTEYIYIYEEANLPEELIIEEPEIIPEIPSKYGFTDSDIYLMTVLLCGSGATDGDGEYDIDFDNQDNHEQISLVLSVVMNRVMSDKFQNTVSDVIWAPGQFVLMPRWANGMPKVSEESYQIVKKWCEAYDSHDMSVMSIPENHLYFAGNGVVNRSRERW